MKSCRLLLFCQIACYLVLVPGCEVKKEMSVKTGSVFNILATSAEASGTIVDVGGGITGHGHCYSKAPGVTIEDPRTELGKPSGTGNFTSQITGLEEGVTYYINTYLSSGKETAYGTETSFTTKTSPMVLSTDPSDGTEHVPVNKHIGVTFSQTMDPATITSSTFIIRYESITVSGTVNYSGNTAIFTPAGNLLPGITYTALITTNLKSAAGVPVKNELVWRFTTQQQAGVSVAAATSVTNTTAVINGVVNANGAVTTVSFDYGLTALYGSSINSVQGSVTGSTPLNTSAILTGLTPGTTYHYRVNANNPGGISVSTDQSFTTHQYPEAFTNQATSVAVETATLNGSVNATGLSAAVTFEYGTSVSYGHMVNAVPELVTGMNNTSVSANITGLAGGTNYHFRVKAVSTGGTTYGDDLTFITQPKIQVILTILDATTWTPENTDLTVAPDAIIKIFASQSSFNSNIPEYIYTSDINGLVNISGLMQDHEYLMVVVKNDLSNILNGYIIQKTYDSQAEIDTSPSQPGAYVGGPKYLDVNADWVLNSYDRLWHDGFTITDNLVVEKTVVIGK